MYLTTGILQGIDAHRLMREPVDAIVAAAKRGSVDASIPLALRAWIRDGRRTVIVQPDAVATLLDAPAVDPDDASIPGQAIELVYPEPVPCEYEAPRRVRGCILWRLTDADGSDTPGQWMHVPGLTAGYPDDAPDGDLVGDGRVLGHVPTSARLALAVVRALADTRVHSLTLASGAGTALRKARRTGARVQVLRLAPDALSVWTRAAATPATPATPHRPPCLHVVADHHARMWVLQPRSDEQVLARRDNLSCVLRPRRGCVRGHGDPAARVSLLRPDRSTP